MARLLRSQPPQPQYSPLPPPPAPPVVTTLSVNFASGLLTRQRRAQQRGVMGWDGGGQADGRSLSFSDVSSNTEIGSTSLERSAVLVTPAANGFLTEIRLSVRTNGAPTDSLCVALAASDGSATPNPNYLAVASVPGSALTSDFQDFAFKFGGTPLTAATNYWLVVFRSGAIDDANDYLILTSGVAATRTGYFSGTWHTGVGGAFSRTVSTANSLTQIAVPMTQRLVGPRPPLLVKAPPTDRQTTLSVNLASGLLTNQRRAQQRRASYDLRPPAVVTTATFVAAPIVVVPASGLLTNQRRAQQRRTTHTLEPPTALQTFAGPQTNCLHIDRIGRRYRRFPTSFLEPPTVVAAAFVAPPPAVYCLQPDRLARRYRRLPSQTSLYPPTTLAVFAGPTTKLVATRPRPTHRVLAPPTVIRVPAVEQREQTITVTLTHTRPRATAKRLAPPTALQVFTGPTTKLVVTRPRLTRSRLAAPAVVAAAAAIYPGPTTKLVRTRPRLTVWSTSRLLLVQPPYPVETVVQVTTVRARPRPASATVAPPTLLTVFQGPAVHTVRTRPRKTISIASRLVVVAAPAPVETVILAAAVRRPRTPAVHSRLPVVIVAAAAQAFYGPTVELAKTRRPAAKTAHVGVPTVLQVFSGPDTPLTRTRPRPTTHRLQPPATLEPFSVELREQTITVALAPARRPVTVSRLTSVSYPATSAIRVKLVRTRPAAKSARVEAPTVFAPTDTTISVTLVHTRPRATAHRFVAPATLEPFAVELREQTIAVRLIRTRPRPTVHELTAVSYPATSEIAVTLVRTRPRAQAATLGQPTALQSFAGPSVHLAPARRPKPTSRLAPPATLEPYAVELQEETIRVHLAPPRRGRPSSRLSYVVYAATSEIQVTLVRTRPRLTVHALGEPTVLQTFAGPVVAVTKTRPRATGSALAAPTVVRVPSVEQREQTISVTLVHTRPRPTTKFIVPPVVRTFPPVVTTLTVVTVTLKRRGDQIRRSVEHFLRPPTVVIPLPTLRVQTIQVTLTRTRPRPTTRRLYRPTALSVFRAAVLPPVRTRPRATQALLQPPAAIRVPAVEQRLRTISVELVRTRPRPFRAQLDQPTALQVFTGPQTHLAPARRPVTGVLLQPLPPTRPERTALETDLRVSLVARRLDAQPHSRLFPPTVVETATAAIRVTLAPARRPGGVHSRLAPPTALQPERTTIETDLRVNLVARRLDAQPHSRLQPPAELEPTVTRIRVALARVRPPRATAAQLFDYVVAARAAVEKNIATTVVRIRPQPTAAAVFPPTRLRPPETTVRTHLVRRATRPGAASLQPPTVVEAAFVAPPIQVTLAPARRPSVRVELSAPTVLAAAPVITDLTVVLVALGQRALHRPVRHFTTAPAVLRVRKGGRSEGSTVPASASEGGSSRSTGSEGGTRPAGASSGEASAQHRATIRDVPSARSEGEDRS